MTILEALRGRKSTEGTATSSHQTGSQPAPFEGYDRIDGSELIHTLADHSQVELEAAEAYERAHKNRPAVLDKLRYLRGPEPLPGYDALGTDQILMAVADADDKTIKKARGYERKFAKRPEILEAIATLQHERRAALPAAAVPSYQPQSAPKDD